MSNGHLWTGTILSLLFMAATDRLCDKLRLIELETTKVQNKQGMWREWAVLMPTLNARSQ
jgi:hypothetical protein